MYVEVVVALPVFTTFYYYSPIFLEVGEYIRVPFASKFTIALVINISSECKLASVKNVDRKVDIPRTSTTFIQFIQWLAQYNIIPCGTILKLSLSSVIEGETYYRILQDITGKSSGDLAEGTIINSTELCKTIGIRSSTLEKFLLKKVIAISDITELINPQIKYQLTLSAAQELVLAKVRLYYEQYQTILLEGVTGSGKTEVYIGAIAEILQRNADGQALILLPEIVLTAQLLARLQKYFTNVHIVEWHSALSSLQRKINWWKIVSGQGQIIIGARSALLLQYKRLKIIVVDEEHDSSFKSTHGHVNYHARDMAIVRAKQEKIPIILSSATPSLESFYNTQQGKFLYLQLSGRYGDVHLPSMTILDMKKNKPKHKKWLSDDLYVAIHDYINRGQQVLLFLNRRGYTPLTLCSSCGYRIKCVNCSAWLVKHNIYQAFICHHCSYRMEMINECSECGAQDSWVACGPGVERVEEEVKQQIPSARVLVMSSDMQDSHQMVRAILEGKVDIIIGTQVMAKGHHFPNLNLVGIVDADASLYGGDLRSAERTYQMLQQVAGRAGRESNQGQVIMQSYNPEVIKAIFTDKDFRQHELQSRQKHEMPPFRRITALTITHHQHQKVQEISREIAQSLYNDQLKVLGPVPANIHLVRRRYIYKIIITTARNFNIQGYLKKCKLLDKYRRNVSIDIDSINFL